MNRIKGLSEEETKACIRFFVEYGQYMAPVMPLVMAWMDLWKRLYQLDTKR